ncbi:MAG: VWA domain-containing protein [Treponema sp.]|jgi:Ca-activated chloride channel family protein|nr:VWA domain-containing protein [Treponema sp.]
MSFESPRLLYALFTLIPLAILMLIQGRKRRVLEAFFAERAGAVSLGLRYFLSSCLFLLCIASLIIALAGPGWGTRLQREYRRGLDLVLAFDLSRSMEVCDVRTGDTGDRDRVEESRLERAVDLAREIIASGVAGMRFAVVIGKSSGALVIPLTWDTVAVEGFLESLSPALITGRGTNLENLVDAAAGVFQDSFPSRRQIVLFSDGESLEGNLGAAAVRAAEAGIAIVALGLGSEAGGPVPGNAAEELVLSRLEAGALREAAERSGGLYLDGSRDDAGALLGDYLAGIDTERNAGDLRRERQSRSGLFALLALGALGFSKLLGKKRLSGRSKAGLLSLGLFLMLSGCTDMPGQLQVMAGNFYAAGGRLSEAIAAFLEAREYPGSAPYAEYGLGTVYLAMDETDAALARFAAAEEALGGTGDQGELGYRIHYNRGVIYFQEGDYTGAAGEFHQALEADGSRLEAKRNLELSLLSVNQAGNAAVPPLPLGAEGGRDKEILFNYIREKEEERWKSREWLEDFSMAGPDY